MNSRPTRFTLRIVFTTTCVFLSAVPRVLSHCEAAQPNVILMMADDMGMGDTSAYQDLTGNGDEVQVNTPQMDRLARMGVRMSDAHTPSSRCSLTRYGLLTGRYPWRNRLKHWVLFGVQGDPMIEADRPTLATLFRDQGYATAMVGKWHVGLRYQESNGGPAAGWDDADLSNPLHTSPLDHGFDQAWFTSRSHGTSGPDAGAKSNPKKKAKRNGVNQSVGPGHVHGRRVVGATGDGKRLVAKGPDAYVLKRLGSRHSDHAVDFLNRHIKAPESKDSPFFLYYPSNSNHSPYTSDQVIDEAPVEGASRTVAGKPMDARHDFIYENDVALGRLLNWLSQNTDPRQPSKKLIETTLVIFTSDNGAERNSDVATGPFRSHKGSVYEGGHRVPFIASWAAGGIGDGNPDTPGKTSDAPISLQDLFATFAEITDVELPRLREGGKGAEDSFSVLPALRCQPLTGRPPLLFHDHKEAKEDPAASAIRMDSPIVDGKTYPGQWKLFFDAGLLRRGEANPYEFYDLASDPWETENLIGRANLKPLIHYLTELAFQHRTTGGHRMAAIAPDVRYTVDLRQGSEAASQWADHASDNASLRPQPMASASGERPPGSVQVKILTSGTNGKGQLHSDDVGLGVTGGKSDESIESGEALLISFDQDVIIESATLVSDVPETCGGFYRVGEAAPLAVYCINADIDAKDQSGRLSDIGVLLSGQTLRLDSRPHLGVETPGSWRLQSFSFRVLDTLGR